MSSPLSRRKSSNKDSPIPSSHTSHHPLHDSQMSNSAHVDSGSSIWSADSGNDVHSRRRKEKTESHTKNRLSQSSDTSEDDASAMEEPPLIIPTQASKAVSRLLELGDLQCLISFTVVILTLLATFMLVQSLVWRLPAALPNDAHPHLFSEGRAWEHLVNLQSIGPSLVGTKSNVAVAEYLEGELLKMQEMVQRRVASGELKHAPTIEIEIQRPSGALNFDLTGFILTNHYTRLHNVIMRLSWNHHFEGGKSASFGSSTSSTSNASSNLGSSSQRADGPSYEPKALLVNSHFDSGVGAPGAMDARACGAVMLELARVLVVREEPLHHPIIFLWNGAEESLQEGSHGFITKHDWRSTVGSVLNFDAGGVGGPQILFQVGSGEYAELFASVAPRLHGSILAQEIFDTGLLQGDTDYRIFRDFGDVHGLDLAWYKDGYKYHTSRDDLNWVEEGSLQHSGDNALAYMTAICSNKTKGSIWRDDVMMKKKEEKSESSAKASSSHPSSSSPDLIDSYPSMRQIIFFDYLGLFTIHYSKTMAMVMHCAVGFAMLYCLPRALPLRQLAFATMSVYASNLAAWVCAFMVACFMTLIGKQMSWFSNQYLVALVYIPAAVFGWLMIQARRSYNRIGKGRRSVFSEMDNHLEKMGGDFLPAGSSASSSPSSSRSKKIRPRVVNGAYKSAYSLSKDKLLPYPSSSEEERSKVSPPSSPSSSSTHSSSQTSSQTQFKSWQLLEFETFHGVSGLICSTLLVWSLLGIGSSYFWFFMCLCSLLAMITTRYFGPDHPTAVSTGVSMIPWYAYLFYLPAMMQTMQIMVQLMAMVFPLAGRMPPDIPVELVVGSLFILLCINIITPAQPLIHRFRRYKGALVATGVILAIAILIASFSFPYSPYRPKRVVIQHAYRTSPMPGHPGLDEPAVLFSMCDSGPSSSLVAPLHEMDSRGASPHRDVHDWDSVFPLSWFLGGYSLPAPMPSLRAPSATILSDQWDAQSSERTVIVKVDYSGSEWSTLKFIGPLVRWNLTKEVPPMSMPGGFHVIRHIGEHGLHQWAVELTFPDRLPRRLDMTASHFVSSPFAQQVIQTMPDWSAILSFTTAMSHIDI